MVIFRADCYRLAVRLFQNLYINISGVDVARVLNEDPNKVFKTLVTVSKSKQNYVFMVPVHKELDLKKCAQSTKKTEKECGK